MDITTSPICSASSVTKNHDGGPIAETAAAMLQRRFDALSDPSAHELVVVIRRQRSDNAVLLVTELLAQRRAVRISSVDA